MEKKAALREKKEALKTEAAAIKAAEAERIAGRKQEIAKRKTLSQTAEPAAKRPRVKRSKKAPSSTSKSQLNTSRIFIQNKSHALDEEESQHSNQVFDEDEELLIDGDWRPKASVVSQDENNFNALNMMTRDVFQI